MGDLFEIKGNPQLNKDSFVFSENGKFPYFTRTVFNNGFAGYVDYLDEEHKIKGNCLAIGMIAMEFFYIEKDFYAGQFTKRAIPKSFKLNSRIARFLISILNKNQKFFQNILVRNFENEFYKTKIKLPIKNNQIDFEFMENFIAELEKEQIVELEAERIAELEAYLSVSGLKNYELTEEEEKVLSDFESNKIEFDSFKIGDLFEIKSSKKRFDANKIKISNKGSPYVVRTNLNNGIRGYINEDVEFLNESNTISFGQDTATMFYQKNQYFTGDKIKILQSKLKYFNGLNAMFFITSMSKSFSSFSWGASSFNVDVIGKQTIKIPVKNSQPDYKTMEIFISAIQKLVIKDVVLYSDKKLNAAKKIVS